MEKKDKDILKKEIKEEPLVHDFNKENLKNAFTPKVIFILLVVVILGTVSGYVFSGKSANLSNSSSNSGGVFNSSTASKGTVIGSDDTKTFKDTVDGTLKEGGINGEGAFHLERPGGESQNVYLTSSTVDLSKFINKKIKVWGQTQKAQYAGWLMDVGRIEVL
ncbi:MAG TPA: hypothetical protein VES68_00040 [Candidatus Sulfotelmatobacter sp.]|nr:hypothetical protein [Candidatus Sulfotelmatobacter sp.]